MLLLPYPARRAWLMSFWLVISILSGLVFGALSSLLISSRWFWIGLIVTLSLFTLGLAQRHAISVLYKYWNRIAGFYMRASRVLLKGICFYFTLVVVGRTGTSLELVRPDSRVSMWVPRRTLPPNTYLITDGSSTNAEHDKTWIGSYLSWARQSRNLWAVCLLPFLVLLRTVECEDEERPFYPTDVYTLY